MKTQIFKGESLTRTKVKNNILRIYNLTTSEERYDWYSEANTFAKEEAVKYLVNNNQPLETSHNKVCGVVAALSPVKTWSQNKKCATDLLKNGDCGHMKQFKKKAKDILASNGSDEEILSILNGNKISAFYLNISYPTKANVVTIDRHALSIALGKWITDDDYRGITTNQYNFFVQCYALAAKQVNATPLLVQSATWVKWRNIKQNYR